MLCEAAQPSEPMANTASETNTMLRRPKASDKAPCHRIMIANDSM